MKKILITQHYSRNKGNVSLLYTLVEVLKTRYPSAEIVVSSFDPTDTALLFGYQTCEWPFRTRIIADSKGLKRLYIVFVELINLVHIVLISILMRFRVINSNNFTGKLLILKYINDSNIVISPGGHLFTNYNNFVQIFAHFFPCFLSVILRKNYVVLAQTLGPFFGKWQIPTKMLTKYVLTHANFVTIRDVNSFEQISLLKIKINDLMQTNEIVYLFPESNNSKKPEKTKKILGFTFHHIYYKRWMTKADYINRMVNFINRINQQYDLDIQFISMEKDVKMKSDLPLLNEIKFSVNYNVNIDIKSISPNPNDLLNVFGALDFLVATKTHSVVYGLRKCIPTLAIAYEKKTDDFMRDFGQEDFSVSLANFDPEYAFSRFTMLVDKNNDIKEIIKSKLINVQAKSFENIELLAEFLK